MAITQVNLPAVYGAAQQYKQGQAQNQLMQLQLQGAQKDIERSNQLTPLLPQAAQGDKQAIGQVTGIDPNLGMRFQEHAMKMEENQRARMTYEAPLLARAMANAQDQDSYAAALNMAASRGVDVSDMPEEYDPNTVSLMVAMGQEADKLQPTGAMKDAQALGYQPGSPEYANYIRERTLKPGSTNIVNVGPTGVDYGKPPQDYAWARDEQGKVMLSEPDENGYRSPIAVPVKGGPVERKIASEEEEKKATAEAKAQGEKSKATTANIVVEDIDRVFDLMDSSALPVTGFGAWAAAIPGTPQRDVAALVDTVRANVGFDKLQAMREASPTGGALGQVSENENRLLQSTLGNLEQSQSPEQFRRNLERVKDVFLDIVHGVGNRPEQESEGSEEVDFSAMSTDELLNVDATKLSTEQLDALLKAMDEAGL